MNLVAILTLFKVAKCQHVGKTCEPLQREQEGFLFLNTTEVYKDRPVWSIHCQENRW
jgi:hypothetical protein